MKKHTLKNGLRVVLLPEKNTFAVTVLALCKTGSKHESKEISGISHFLEHLLFKGTKKRPSQIAIAEPLDRVGGAYNAFTGEEYTGYYAKVDAKHFELALDIISDIYLNSKLDSKEINRERNVIIEEINMYYDHPIYYVQNLWMKVLYGDQPAGWDIAGTKESLRGIKRKTLEEYLKSQYVSSNTVICIAGNFNEKRAKEKVAEYFSNIKNTSFKEKAPVKEEQTSPQCLVHNRKTDQTHFCLGVRGYDLFDEKRYAKQIISVLLGGMMSSRLFMEVREKLGLAYYVKTEASFDTDTGFLVTRAGVKNEKAEKAVSVVLKEYKKAGERGFSSKEILKGKAHLKGKMALALESSDNKASFFGLQELLKGETLTLNQIYDKIDEVSPEDIRHVAEEIFRPEKLNLALIGPFKDNKKFLKLLWKKKNH